jgi:crossover junction endodeoxyribonuclease RusA
MLTLTLPYPPTVNHYYGQTKSGSRFIKPKGKAFRDEVIVRFIQQRNLARTMIGKLSVTIEAYPPDNRKRDLDNINKALLDALEHARVYENDNQIIELISRKHPAVANGKVIVTIKEQFNGDPE